MDETNNFFFETETETFGWWYQSLRLILRIFTLVSRIETDTETLNMWSQGLRPRPPKSQSQSWDQSLAQVCLTFFFIVIFTPSLSFFSKFLPQAALLSVYVPQCFSLCSECMQKYILLDHERGVADSKIILVVSSSRTWFNLSSTYYLYEYSLPPVFV